MAYPNTEPLVHKAAAEYYEQVERALRRVAGTQMEAIGKAALLVADVVGRDGILYTFGSGHSQSVAIEMYYRAGGLACVDVIHDKTFGRAERLAGYAEALLEGYPVSGRDAMLIVSNSGRNALPVEMALGAKKRGMETIAITSLDHSRSVESRHDSGLRLCEICDIVIDNCAVAGDATVELNPTTLVGPVSTLTGVFIANNIAAVAAEELLRRNTKPPVFLSMNLDEGDSRNREYLERGKGRIRGL